METLKIMLKQHTPIIHFQHNQEGATLRATEVKPKLDRFIIKEAYNNDFEKCKEYLVGYSKDREKVLKEKFDKGYRALNYKMRIEAKDCITINDLPMFLGNMGKNSEEKINGKISRDDLVLEILALNKDILPQIKQSIVEFFSLHNFGSRQTKGYGSFSVENIGKDTPPAYNYNNVSYLKFQANTQAQNQLKCNDFYKKIFETIDYYWKRLKSGINYSSHYDKGKGKTIKFENRYHKAFLFKYLEDDKFTYSWEKRFVKEKFYKLSPKNTPKNNNPKFARAMLGQPDKFTYTRPNYLEEGNVEYPPNQKDAKKDEIYILHSEIERIASPIIFKPIVNGNTICVYILINSKHIEHLYQGNLEEKFEFKKTGEGKRSDEEEPKCIISLPDSIIDYEDLLNQYHCKELKNKFTPKNYKWNDIVEKVEIFKNS